MKLAVSGGKVVPQQRIARILGHRVLSQRAVPTLPTPKRWVGATPVWAKAESSPAALSEPTSSSKLDALQQERDLAAARLAAADADLRAELQRQEALVRSSSGEGERPAGRHLDRLHHRNQEELDNFGFIRQFSGEPYEQEINGVPGSLMEMGFENFLREGRELAAWLGIKMPALRRGEIGLPPPDNTPQLLARQEALSKLTLSNAAVWERENARPPIRAPWVIKGPYLVLCVALDVIFDGRPIQRFWFLETVARMPYFSYINMLHLYETLGWWRRSLEARKVHAAEEFNESAHLLIMESLGGDQRWVDRFMAQHAAIVYYVILLILWILSPTLAYNFSELIEGHAVDTYRQFVEENEEALKQLPPPRVARLYYEDPQRFLFDEFQTRVEPGTRRPVITSLYDVFVNVSIDEGEHVNTMHDMQDEDVLKRAPNTEALLAAAALALIGAQYWTHNSGLNAAVGDGAEAGGSGLLETVGLEAVLDFLTGLLPFL